ncbi:MAG: hypothetical protein PVI56_12040 [Gammaproteobacteria bacterium]
MKFIKQLTVLAGLALLGSPLLAQAGAPLTKHDVVQYMHFEVRITKTQNDMKAHAAQYDNVIQAFFKKEDAILAEKGWTRDRYKDVQSRIFQVLDAMEKQASMDAYANQRAKERADIMNNPYIPEKQKKQILKAKGMLHQHDVDQVAGTRPDWPAVKPYRKTLIKLGHWAAGNTPEPPQLPDL